MRRLRFRRRSIRRRRRRFMRGQRLRVGYRM